MTDTSTVLQVENLTVGYPTERGMVEIIEDVSFQVAEGESLAIVGESGSGKSVTLLAALGLLPAPLEVLSGSIRLRGKELTDLNEHDWRRIRGKDIAMVFQDPMSTLNPVKRVGTQLARAVRAHSRDLDRRQAEHRVTELLEAVGIGQARERARAYPHQWSGGMRQRAVIGMAVANNPSVLLADEPTTALDVTVQAQVIDVLARQRAETGAALILITHDLGLVAQVADRVAVMYTGRFVEQGMVEEIFDHPRHPYTRGLLNSLLTAQNLGQRAYAIPGAPPAVADRPDGCPFAPRCEHPAKGEACAQGRPAVVPLTSTQSVACVPETEGVRA